MSRQSFAVPLPNIQHVYVQELQYLKEIINTAYEHAQTIFILPCCSKVEIAKSPPDSHGAGHKATASPTLSRSQMTFGEQEELKTELLQTTTSLRDTSAGYNNQQYATRTHLSKLLCVSPRGSSRLEKLPVKHVPSIRPRRWDLRTQGLNTGNNL